MKLYAESKKLFLELFDCLLEYYSYVLRYCHQYILNLLLKVEKLSDNAVLPSRASPLSAGYDLSIAVETKISARGKTLVATDRSISIPEGTYACIALRLGFALKHSIDVGAGVIDADYRRPVGMILFNQSTISEKIYHSLVSQSLHPYLRLQHSFQF
nr:deoxyuridine 5'-triphosphate nucleotidohydrolase-like [Arachis hypogaea]